MQVKQGSASAAGDRAWHEEGRQPCVVRLVRVRAVGGLPFIYCDAYDHWRDPTYFFTKRIFTIVGRLFFDFISFQVHLLLFTTRLQRSSCYPPSHGRYKPIYSLHRNWSSRSKPLAVRLRPATRYRLLRAEQGGQGHRVIVGQVDDDTAGLQQVLRDLGKESLRASLRPLVVAER